MRKAFQSLWIALLLIAVLSGVTAAGGRDATLPAGTQIQVRLLNQLDTGAAQAGQTFSATVAGPVVTGGRTVLAAGSKVSGRVMEAVSSGRLKRPASITLELTEAGGRSVTTEPLRIDGKSHLLRNVAIIGGETAAGAIIGGATGGKKGAAIGAAIGAGAGTATAYMTGKKEIVLPVEMALTFSVSGGGQGTETAGIPASRTQREARSERQARERRKSDESEEGENRGRESRYADEDEGERRGRREARDAAEALTFSEHDQRLVRRYFETNTANLPPGLAKRGGHLPPGLERQLERNGTLPPGLQKRLEPLPRELSQQLPPLPAGYSRVVLGVRALILDRNNRILDLMFIR
jgi:hypothetical protein